MADSAFWHKSKNLFLLCLSLVFLPINTVIIAVIDLLNWLPNKSNGDGQPAVQSQKTILVTGLSMSKGLALARLFSRSGHKVIGADISALSLGQVSRAIHTFHALPAPREVPSDDDDDADDPYVLRLLSIVKQEGVDIWVSVSDVATALQDALAKDFIEAHTTAKAIQFKTEDIRLLHEKDSFMQHTAALGLPIPDTQVVANESSIISFLSKRGGMAQRPGGHQYLIKPIGVNDLARFDMPLLPLLDEQSTLRRIEEIPFDGRNNFIVQEFVSGPEYCTYSLVVKGQVKAFVACPSSELLMHYTALPAESPLSQAMLAFTQKMAEAGGESFTGHLSFDFIVKAHAGDKKGSSVELFPIECNPRVHTAVVLFNNTPELADAYISVLDNEPPGQFIKAAAPLAPKNPAQYYWVGQELIEQVVCPVTQYLSSGGSKSAEVRESFSTFARHVRSWKDGVFETWDPWPWWWLYHVYWPVRFARYLALGRWHKVNVSTGKEFQAK